MCLKIKPLDLEMPLPWRLEQMKKTAAIKWYTANDELICEDCNELTVEPEQATTYKVRVENDYGCSSEAQVQVLVNDGCEFGIIDIPT